jgi:hypothetical protein
MTRSRRFNQPLPYLVYDDLLQCHSVHGSNILVVLLSLYNGMPSPYNTQTRGERNRNLPLYWLPMARIAMNPAVHAVICRVPCLSLPRGPIDWDGHLSSTYSSDNCGRGTIATSILGILSYSQDRTPIYHSVLGLSLLRLKCME